MILLKEQIALKEVNTYMEMVALTALGVGGATAIGALIGFLFKNPSHKLQDIILSFAAGVMLSAAVVGLVLPSLEYYGEWYSIAIAYNWDAMTGKYTVFCKDGILTKY